MATGPTEVPSTSGGNRPVRVPRVPPQAAALALAAAQRAVSGTPRPGRAGTVVSVILTGLGAAALAVPARQMVRHRTTVDPRHPERAAELVTDGAYAVSRNPMYLADVLLLAAHAARLGRAAPWLAVPAFVLWMTPQIRAEEAALTAAFSDRYDRYRARVRRWL